MHIIDFEEKKLFIYFCHVIPWGNVPLWLTFLLVTFEQQEIFKIPLVDFSLYVFPTTS